MYIITDECALRRCFFRGYCEQASSRCSCDSGYTGNRCEREVWSPPSEWTGPSCVLYYSFDSRIGLTLMSGSKHTNYNPLVSGQVNIYYDKRSIVEFSHHRQSWQSCHLCTSLTLNIKWVQLLGTLIFSQSIITNVNWH